MGSLSSFYVHLFLSMGFSSPLFLGFYVSIMVLSLNHSEYFIHRWNVSYPKKFLLVFSWLQSQIFFGLMVFSFYEKKMKLWINVAKALLSSLWLEWNQYFFPSKIIIFLGMIDLIRLRSFFLVFSMVLSIEIFLEVGKLFVFPCNILLPMFLFDFCFVFYLY